MADPNNDFTVPQLLTSSQAGAAPPGHIPGALEGFMSVAGPGIHARQQAELDRQTKLRNFYWQNLQEGLRNGTVKADPSDPMYSHFMDQINGTLGKDAKGVLGKMLPFIQHFARGITGPPQAAAATPPPSTGSPVRAANRADLDAITAAGGGGAGGNGSGSPPAPPSATVNATPAASVPSSADLTRGRGATPFFNQAPSLASNSDASGAQPTQIAQATPPPPGPADIFHTIHEAGVAESIRHEIEAQRAKAQAEWDFQLAHNPNLLKIKQIEEGLGEPLSDLQKSQVLGIIPKNTVKTWSRDPGGRIYSVSVNKLTNQPIPGTENYNDIGIPPSLQTHVKTGEHFYVDADNNLRAVPTQTTTAPVIQPGGPSIPSATKPKRATAPASAAAPGNGNDSGVGAKSKSGGRTIGPAKSPILIAPPSVPGGQPTAIAVRPGQPVPTGAVTTQGFSSVTVPTSATRSRSEFATGLIPQVDRTMELIDKAAPKLGALKGRYNEFIAGKLGGGLDDDPEISALRTDVGLLQTGMMVPHVGARGGVQLISKFKNLIDSGKASAPQLNAALGEMRKFLVQYAAEGQLKGWGREPIESGPPVSGASRPPLSSFER